MKCWVIDVDIYLQRYSSLHKCITTQYIPCRGISTGSEAMVTGHTIVYYFSHILFGGWSIIIIIDNISQCKEVLTGKISKHTRESLCYIRWLLITKANTTFPRCYCYRYKKVCCIKASIKVKVQSCNCTSSTTSLS